MKENDRDLVRNALRVLGFKFTGHTPSADADHWSDSDGTFLDIYWGKS